MRIVASDYDGTICTRGRLNGDVVAAIQRFRAAGNIFGIATGRDFDMTVYETDRWGIPFDFLVCINGAAIYDHDRKLLRERNMDDGLIPAILNHPAGLASLHYQLSSTRRLNLFLREGSWFPQIGVPYDEVDFATALGLTGLGQISLAYTSEEECGRHEEALRKDFGAAIEPHRNKTTIDINTAGVDKATGIAELVALKGWAGEIVTVGDGGNDIGMLKAYRGFTVPEASKDVVKAGKCVCGDVAELLEELMGTEGA